MKPSINFWTLSRNIGIAFWILIFVPACTSNEIGNSRDVAQDKIFQEYRVSYNEGDEKIKASAVFRFAGTNGTTLVLNKPGKVELDNEELKVDSTDFRGAYYDAEKIAAQWMGSHEWKFTDINNKVYKNEFLFDEFKWDNIPSSIKKFQPLTLYFNTVELDVDDYIQVNTVESDSSFSVTQGPVQTKPFSVTIPAADLQKQKQSTLKLEAVRVQKIKLQQHTGEGGEFIIRYTLQPITFKLISN